MIKNTLILMGPGGVGKGPLADLIRDDAAAIDPYRLRPKGPRTDSPDPLYANPKLRAELHEILISLGDSCREIPCGIEKLEWFAKSRVLFFTVRAKEWQCLILGGLTAEFAKAELYAPVLPGILGISEIREALGCPKILILNPASSRLRDMGGDWSELKNETRTNCEKRDGPGESVEKRVGSVDQEAPEWLKLVEEQGAIDLSGWPFAEYKYGQDNKRQLLMSARDLIIERAPELERFLKTKEEL